MVSHCDSWMSSTSSLKLLAGILPNFGRDDSYIDLINDCSNVVVRCSRVSL